MFTKKTRVLSALLTVCMLISMLACFVVPASAAVVSAKGLKDVSHLPDIKDLASYEERDTDGMAYKITDREGLENLASLTGPKSRSFADFTFYLANDIDMEWENFIGIALGNTNKESGLYAFKANFDGNGFVIKNLLMYQPKRDRVGFINYFYGGDGAVVRNLGIANGLIIGGVNNSYAGTGSIIGEAWNGRMENCWSAATVINTNGAPTGGLIGTAGRAVGKPITDSYINNSYFVGTVSGSDASKTGGLTGVATNPNFVSANSYVIGDDKDAATLNQGLTTAVEGYDVRYADSSNGYPVLTYYKSGESTPYVQRVPDYSGNKAGAYTTNQLVSEMNFTLNEQSQIVSGTKETAIYLVLLKKNCAGIEMASEYLYYKAGEKFTVPTIEGYELKNAPEGFTVGTEATMPARDVTLTYSTIDFDVIRGIKEQYSAYNPIYFDGDSEKAFIAITAACDKILAEEAKAEADRDIAFINEQGAIIEKGVETVESGILSAKWSDFSEEELYMVPNFSEYETYKDFGVKAWAVSTKEEWIALTEAGTATADYHIYIKENIDFGGAPMKPLCFGEAFTGSIHGMGHYFENIKIEAESVSGDCQGVALISATSGTVHITDLGIKSGSVEKLAHSAKAESGLAMFVAYSSGGSAHFDRCWTGPETKLIRNSAVTEDNISTGVFAGSDSAVVTNCYSYTKGYNLSMMGLVTGSGNAATSVQNSVGAVMNNDSYTDLSEHGTYLARFDNGDSLGFAKNAYVIGAQSVTNKTGDSYDGDKLGANLDPSTQGAEIAWRLNNGRNQFSTVANNAAYQADTSDWVYWTVDENGYAVFGDEENQIRSIAVVANGEVYRYYGKAGDEITLDLDLGVGELTYALVSGLGATLEGNKVTIGNGEVTVKVTNVIRHSVDMALNLYAGKDLSYFADAEAIQRKIDLVSEREYVSQDSINRDAADLVNLYVPNPDVAFPLSYREDGFAMGSVIFEGYNPLDDENVKLLGINSEEDLLYANENIAKLTAGRTLVLGADLNLKNSSFQQFNKLAANFDGNGHVILDHIANVNSFFFDYAGTSIKNVVFDFTQPITRDFPSTAIICNAAHTNGMVFENITLRNAMFNKTEKANGTAGVLGETSPNNTYYLKNISIENCSFVVTQTTSGSGFVVGWNTQNNAVLNIDGVRVVNSSFGTKGTKGYLVGSIEKSNTTTTNINNALLVGNSGATALFVGEFWGKTDNVHTLNITNSVAMNNGGHLAIYRNTDSYKSQTLKATNLYSDVDTMSPVYATVNDITDEKAIAFKEGTTIVTADAFMTPEGVYNYNEKVKNVAGAMQIALKDGTLVHASETVQAPHKVTFGTEPDSPVFYTDANGKLTGDTSLIAPLTDCGFSVEDPVNHVYTEDTVVYIYTHHVPAGEPDSDGTHIGECMLCHEDILMHCEPEVGYPKPYSDREIESAILNRCKICHNEWLSNIIMKDPTLEGVTAWNAPANSTVTIPVKTINFLNVSMLAFEITYDQAVVTDLDVVTADKSCTVNVIDIAAGKRVEIMNNDPYQPLGLNGDGVLFDLVLTTGAAGNCNVIVSLPDDMLNAAIYPANGFTTQLTVHDKLVGDVDLSGDVDTGDVVKMMRYLLDKTVEGTFDTMAADFNGDQVVNLLDVVDLCRDQSTNP